MVTTSLHAERSAETDALVQQALEQLRTAAPHLRERVIQLLKSNIAEMIGPFSSMRQIPTFADQIVNQFLDVLDRRLTPQQVEIQMRYWVQRGFGPEGAFAVVEALYEQAKQIDETRVLTPALDEYRHQFSVSYEVGRRAEILAEHERMQRSLYAALEKQIASEREARLALQRRQAQLQVAADLARVTTLTRDLNELLSGVVRQLQESFSLDFAGIFLLDNFQQWAILRAGAGVAGSSLLTQGYQLKLDQHSPVSQALTTKQALILRTGRFQNQSFDVPLQPETAMAIVLPLTARGVLLGALTLHSADAAAFADQDVPLLQVMTDNIAYAIENAELFARSQASLEELERAQRGYVRDTWETVDLDKEIVYSQSKDSFQSLADVPTQASPSSNGNSAQDALSIPITLRGQVIGTVDVFDVTQPREWSSEDKALASSVVEQLALAVDNARLFEQSQQRAEELAAINEITNVISQQLELDRLLAEVHTQVQRVMVADAFFVSLYDESTDMIAYPFVYDDGKRYESSSAPLSPRGSLRQVIDTGKSILLNRTPQEILEAQTRMNQETAMGDQSKVSASLLYAPLRLGERIVGVISAQSYMPNTYKERDVELLEGIGIHVAVALQNARLFETTQRRAQETAVLNELARELSGELDQEKLFANVYKYLPRLMSVDAFVVWFYDAATHTVTRPVLYDLDLKYPANLNPLPPTDRLERVLTTNQSLIVNLTRQEWEASRQRTGQTFGSGEASASMLYVPLRVGNQTRGFISVQSYQFNAYGDQQVALLTSVANTLATALENAQLFEETRKSLNEITVLHDSMQTLASELELATILSYTAEQFLGVLDMDTATFLLVDEANNELVTLFDNDPRPELRIPAGTRLPIRQYPAASHFLDTNEPLIFLADDPALAPVVREDMEQYAWKTLLVLPLLRKGRVAGIIELGDLEHVRRLSKDDLRLAVGLAAQASVALENAQLFEQTQQALAETQLLYQLSAQVNRAQTLDELMSTVGELSKGTSINRVVLTGLDYDAEGEIERMVVRATWYSGQGTRPSPVGTVYPRVMYENLPQLVSPTPLFFTDLHEYGKTDPSALALAQRLNIRSLAVLPLQVSGRQIGSILLIAEELHQFQEKETKPYLALAQQIATVVENRRLFEQTREALAETQLLYGIGGQLNQVGSLEELVRIAAQPAFAQGAGSSQLLLLDYREQASPSAADVVVSLLASGEPAPFTEYTHFPIEQFTLGQALLANPRELVLVEDVNTNPVVDDATRAVLLASRTQAVALLPLSVEQHVLGVIVIGWENPHVFGAQERRIYQALAGQMALVLNNRLLFKQTEEALEETQSLYGTSALLNGAINVQDALEAAAGPAMMQGAQSANLLAIETDANNRPEYGSIIASWSRTGTDSAFRNMRFQFAHVPVSNLWIENPTAPVLIEDIETDSRVDENARALYRRSQTRATVLLPMRLAERWVGLIVIAWDQPRTFAERDVRLYSTIMSQATTVLDNRRLFEQTQEALAETRTLYEIGAGLNAANSVQEALEAAANPAIVQGAVSASLLRVYVDEAGEPRELELVGQWPLNPNSPMPIGTRFSSDFLGDDLWLKNPTEPRLIGNIETAEGLNPVAQATYLRRGLKASALLPLRIGTRWVGLLSQSWAEPRVFTERDVRLFTSVMAQASTVLDNRALFEQTQQALAETQTLYEIGARLTAATTLQQALEAAIGPAVVQGAAGATLSRTYLDANGDPEEIEVLAIWPRTEEQEYLVGLRFPYAVFASTYPVPQTQTGIAISEDTQADSSIQETAKEFFRENAIGAFASLPLTVGDRQVGFLSFNWTGPHRFSAGELRLYRAVSSQMATVSENRLLFQQTQSALAQTQTALTQVQEAQERLNLQYQTANILARATSFEHAATHLLENTCRALNWQLGEYWAIDEAANRLVLTHLWCEENDALREFSTDSYGMIFERGEGLSGRTWAEARPIWVPDISQDPMFKQVDKALQVGLVSALAFPLQSETRQFGVTVFFTTYRAELDDALLTTMVGVGSQIGQFLERRRAEEAVRQQNTYLTALHDTTLGLMRRLDLRELLQNIITRAGELVGTEHGYVHLIEPSGAELRMHVGIGIYQDFVGTRVKLGQGLAGTVWRNQEPIVVDDYRYWSGRLPMVDRDVLRAVVGVPLKSHDQTVGVLGLASLDEGRTFSAAQVEALNRFAELATVALDNAQLYSASQDALQQTQRLAEREKASAQIADKLYAAADVKAVLRTAAEELRRSTGSKRAIVRLNFGGDSKTNGGPKPNGEHSEIQDVTETAS